VELTHPYSNFVFTANYPFSGRRCPVNNDARSRSN
jgi:hypothetical protein